MCHNREEMIKRTIREFERLDHLVNNLADEDWDRLLARPETKDPWPVKDTLAHITHWKADNVQPLCGPCNSSKRDNHIDYRKEYDHETSRD